MYVCSVLQMETLKSDKRLVEENKYLREEKENLIEENRHSRQHSTRISEELERNGHFR